MGGFVVLIVGVLFVITATVVGFIAWLAAASYYARNNPQIKTNKILGSSSLFALLIFVTSPFLFIGLLAIGLNMDSNNYWGSEGAYDYFRMPLEYPYELVMIDVIDDADINVWHKSEATMTIEISGIKKYYKDGNIIVGMTGSLDPREKGKARYFTFDCGTGKGRTFKSKEDYLDAIGKLGFEKEPKLLTIRENWDMFWDDESNWKNRKIPKNKT